MKKGRNVAARNRTAGGKLLFCILIGLMLSIPLFAVYLLVWDRQSQSSAARAAIAQGWGGPQLVAGPVLVIPYTRPETETVTENGRQISRLTNVQRERVRAPATKAGETGIMPERRRKAIYETVLFEARVSWRAASSASL